MIRPKGLGRGLDALLSRADDAAPATQDLLQMLAVDRLRPGKYQPRTRMDAASLAELADSIREQGVMQPILVRPVDGGRYEIVAGERRWRAAQQAGLREVPTLVKTIPDQSALALSLIENIQREDLNPIEEAQAYRRLSDELQMSQESIASAVGKDRATVANYVRLLRLPVEVRNDLASAAISMGHARALLALPTDTAQRDLAREVSVRETEALVRKETSPEPPVIAKPTDPNTRAAEEQLRLALGTRARIIRRGHRGRIEIDFTSEDELQRLFERLTTAM
jgi:ParB family chromosome partitioning protein